MDRGSDLPQQHPEGEAGDAEPRRGQAQDEHGADPDLHHEVDPEARVTPVALEHGPVDAQQEPDSPGDEDGRHTAGARQSQGRGQGGPDGQGEDHPHAQADQAAPVQPGGPPVHLLLAALRGSGGDAPDHSDQQRRARHRQDEEQPQELGHPAVLLGGEEPGEEHGGHDAEPVGHQPPDGQGPGLDDTGYERFSPFRLVAVPCRRALQRVQRALQERIGHQAPRRGERDGVEEGVLGDHQVVGHRRVRLRRSGCRPGPCIGSPPPGGRLAVVRRSPRAAPDCRQAASAPGTGGPGTGGPGTGVGASPSRPGVGLWRATARLGPGPAGRCHPTARTCHRFLSSGPPGRRVCGHPHGAAPPPAVRPRRRLACRAGRRPPEPGVPGALPIRDERYRIPRYRRTGREPVRNGPGGEPARGPAGRPVSRSAGQPVRTRRWAWWWIRRWAWCPMPCVPARGAVRAAPGSRRIEGRSHIPP